MNIFIMVFLLTFVGVEGREWTVESEVKYTSMEVCQADRRKQTIMLRGLLEPGVQRLVMIEAGCIKSNEIYV